MSNLQRHKDCPMRSEIGNCLAIGGFCTSVSKEICEALQNAYTKGRHSVEVSADAISRKWVLNEIITKVEDDDSLTDEQKGSLSAAKYLIRHAPPVVPSIVPIVDVDEWIKAEEALPDKRGFHIVTIEDEYGQRWTDVARYNRMDNDALNDIYRFDVAPIIGKVVAWKPLPKAFTEDNASCNTCRHNKLKWNSEECFWCTKANSNYEPTTE